MRQAAGQTGSYLSEAEVRQIVEDRAGVSGTFRELHLDRDDGRTGLAVSALGMLLTWLAGSAWLAMGGIFLIGLGFAPMYPAMLHATPSYFGAELSQQVMGVEMAFAYVGSTCFPPLFGALAAPLGTSMYPGFLLACLLLAAAAIELADRLFSVREFCGKGEEQVI